MERKRRQAAARAIQAAQAGRSLGWERLNRLARTVSFNLPRLTRPPQRVSRAALMARPQPAMTKKTARRTMRATGFHFTQAEMARVKSESTTIHSTEAAKSAQASPR